jgi:tRNA(Ile)-lysidine synthase
LIFSGKAVELLGRCRFPSPGRPLDCAVSGGSDSLALLALGVAAGCAATAYHVDHHLRPGSTEEADVVRAAAERLGAGFVALSVECAPGPNLEARARAARRAVLPEGVATGHTADDQAETVLINLMRGAGLDGLAAMRAGPRHPILALRRFEAAELVSSLGLAVVDDPSNTDRRFLRNRVRAELLPLLCELAGRDLVPVLARQAELLAAEAALLDELAAAVDVGDLRALRAEPVATQRRALRRFVRESADSPYAPSAAAIARLLEVVHGERLASELPGGARIARAKGRLVYTPADRRAR